MATHLPLGQVGGYHARAFPKAEPVIAARIGRVPDGMYITVDQPHRSIRTHRAANGEVWAVAVGASFRPGQTDEEHESFADLEAWLRSTSRQDRSSTAG